jgi:dTDP-glucose 4,6-dehydratase
MPRAVVTGGAGFLGSHLCERLLLEGWQVRAFDSLVTGSMDNLQRALSHDAFEFADVDITDGLPVDGQVDAVLHLASPASPVDYLRHPIATMKAGSFGTHLALELARKHGAIFLLTSTSEVYGDPTVHPQPEGYWGNVNPVGPRSVYDEAKRYAEALSMAYLRQYGMPVRIVRIFNTYGPRLRCDDGRAVPAFISQALEGRDLTIHGDGKQTRSLCYVDDLIEAIWRLLGSDHIGPMNIGSTHETTVLELAKTVRSIAGSHSRIVFRERPEDDPEMRCPDISLARGVLGWQPKISLEEGLGMTIDWARSAWAS